MLLLGLSLVEETPITPILAALHCVHLYANETALIHMHLHNMLFALSVASHSSDICSAKHINLKVRCKEISGCDSSLKQLASNVTWRRHSSVFIIGDGANRLDSFHILRKSSSDTDDDHASDADNGDVTHDNSDHRHCLDDCAMATLSSNNYDNGDGILNGSSGGSDDEP
ncbi:hypothetical protein F2P81_014880 [Scophthalmus maximus]|uniref:Uncharacterized protein n=1 Tax=Scophthalmus maximus TaxID=52904 RepID=A0A6A4SL57_SCOMX|nr:hypothetical protein F2P81_014880 [Scophthalmus maximus]